jgi:hypothetical protein
MDPYRSRIPFPEMADTSHGAVGVFKTPGLAARPAVDGACQRNHVVRRVVLFQKHRRRVAVVTKISGHSSVDL